MPVPGVGVIPVDYRMDYAYTWTNFLLNEPHMETGLLRALSNYASLGMVFWDVGANTGLISGNLFKAFPSAMFILFEPNPDLTRRLSQLFLGRKNVTISEIALSDRSARAQLNIIPGKPQESSLLSKAEAGAVPVEVQLETGDEFVARNPATAPSLIKIDVEGHEVSVLRGCQKTIATYRPVIVFEHLFLSDDDLKALIPSGYQIFYIHDHTGELSPVLDRSFCYNAILVPDEKLGP